MTNEAYASFYKSLSNDGEDLLALRVSQRTGTSEEYASFYKSWLNDWEDHLSVTNEAYASFYKSLSNDGEDLLALRVSQRTGRVRSTLHSTNRV